MDDKRIDFLIDNDREWRKHILKQLSDVKKQQVTNCEEIAKLNIKASIWGGVSGGVVVLISMAIFILKKTMS